MPTDSENVCLWGKTGRERHTVKTALLTHCGHWVTAREMARSILERHSGRLELPGAGPHLGSGLLGNPEHRYHSSQLRHHQGNPGQWTLIQMTRSIPSQKLHWSWTPWLQKAYRKKMR